MSRDDGRAPDALRKITFVPNIAPHASGSVLVSFGATQVICAVMVEDGVPHWMKQQQVPGGWLTAEYSMLPYSTLSRKPRDSSRGRIDGRSSEIQRLIGRAMRAVVDLRVLGQRTVWIDCDVLQADGGTRTASITGACVACSIAFIKLLATRKLKASPLKKMVAAVSAGVYRNEAILDLCYVEDRDATVDANFVMTEALEFVEIQSSGEEATFSEAQMSDMLALSKKGVKELVELQYQAIRDAEGAAAPDQLADLAKQFSK
ncbi:MAG: ribonuclease PH [Verrucomicrobiales bacterium]